VEVKSGSRVHEGDLKGLRALAEDGAGRRTAFRSGRVLSGCCCCSSNLRNTVRSINHVPPFPETSSLSTFRNILRLSLNL
jgi:hypothetical protein